MAAGSRSTPAVSPIGCAGPAAFGTLGTMPAEISSGGLVVRRMHGKDWLAVIRPQGRPEGHWALPKGQIDPGESAVETAVREVQEETGLRVEPVQRLDDLRYVYMRDGRRIFKIVSFWRMRPLGGRIGEIAPAMRREVAEARWLPLDEAVSELAYAGERGLAKALLAPPSV